MLGYGEEAEESDSAPPTENADEAEKTEPAGVVVAPLARIVPFLQLASYSVRRYCSITSVQSSRSSKKLSNLASQAMSRLIGPPWLTKSCRG